MDFNVKRLAADAGTFLSRAVQFTEEKLGQAEKTELDAHLENLLAKAECTRHWTEKIMKQTEILLQPNPNVRIEEFLYEKLEKKAPTRMNNNEQLGEYMIDSGNEFGPGTAYGNALIKCGETQKQIGIAEREFIQSSAINFLTPFRNFLEGDFKTVSKERKLLQNKRLDLDAAKTRLKKARAAEARAAHLNSSPLKGDNPMVNFSYMLSFDLNQRIIPLWAEEVTQAEQEVRIAQSEFDRQGEITRLLLEGIGSTHAHHLRCLNDFVEAQTTYYAQCYQYMVDLQKQLGSFPTTLTSNNNQNSSSSAQSTSDPSIPVSSSLPTPANSVVTSGFSELRASCGTRKARVLYDYDAADSSELSLLADEVIIVYSVPGMDTDWLMGERGTQKGRVPITYLELLN
ncbi:endophilin-B1-like isoform X4 [Acipenser ruthenus]|uniref:endophilin-B1-like isoform X4 n=1 Tax=Acipenser ruthenus TaxID=7906 RepID=UPI0027406059|nr:endophilin-B1-like isoform X4 [Acipenser ruthenus]